MEVKVLHEGSLEKCSSADEQAKKDWKKRYFVFKHFPTSSTKCLEYYKDKNWRKQDAKGVLTLFPGYEVLKVFDSKRKFVFDVKTVEHVFRLSANSEDDLNKWILILEKENVVKSFVVEPVLDSVMAKINPPNTCHLFIADVEIRLVSAQDGTQLVAWPFTCLRRYMSSRGKFSLEAGRRAPTGEGKFTFITSQHDEIYKILDNVIKSRAGSVGPTSAPPPRPSDLVMQAPPQQDDSYDHLVSSPLKGVAPVHAAHPNYDQNVSNQKSDSLKSGDYASPYGHMKNRESIASVASSKGEFNLMHGGDGRLDGYNTLTHQTTDNLQCNIVPGDGYDILNPIMPTRKPPPPPISSESTDGNLTEDFYNTIDTKSNKSAEKEDCYDKLDYGSTDDSTYDSLDHQQASVSKPQRFSFPTPFERMRQESFEGDTYNVLAHVGSPVSSPASIGGDEYSTLERTSPHPPLRQTKSFPIPPPRVPTTANDPRMSQGYDRSSISSVSSFGSCEFPSSFKGSRSLPTSDEQDFYSSIDDDVAPKQAVPKPPPKPKPKDADEDKKRHSHVSNLASSLIAGGLNLNKGASPGRKGLRRCSVETIEESDTYDQIKEPTTQSQKRVQNKPSRSPSLPTEAEDIYEDPEISSHQSKPKAKPVKPRKKK